MPWPRDDEVSAQWPSPGVDDDIRCFVYGQGFCGSDKPYFPDFLKRVELADWLQNELNVLALFPETEVREIPGDPDFLRQELELAREQNVDFIVALQPLDTLAGAPTLRSELHDLANDRSLKERVFLFRPESPPPRYNTFDAIASRLPPNQVLEYREDEYVACSAIRDMLCGVVDVVRQAKALGLWPPEP